ncbi:nicotinamide riboside transporter PnuC [Streptacidiphilus sp. ASG 303]|uniref:nicotinamide riboside transporter PnuC n=1 Tax=Streptacidiphilus sp. ASG 303 TaxID=2896847 RepID=UPI001E3BF82D|nr:nicotinamide riboside transporter PnuC [Streptacidiphilus sp. ASG 303]MCD0484002.1 nicotinamide riboside transporter PnuC [Streptacidiphilus sp. ASG 303]
MAVSDALADLVAPLNTVLFHAGADAVTWAELLGFGTGAACVWLTVRAKVANFPVGIANNLFFLVLFWSARLYADALLQVVYLLLAAAGWWTWLHGGEHRTARPTGRATPRTLAVLLLLLVPATWALTAVLARAHDTAPFWDALTTALSLAAQWLLNTKAYENWWFWIAADLVYIPLYLAKDLVLTSAVYVVFLGMCAAGLRAWRRQPDRAAAAPTAVRA